MHAFNRSIFQNLDAKAGLATLNENVSMNESGANAQRAYRFRNLLRPPTTAEAFSLGGLVGEALQGRARPLRHLMRKLAARIGRERWTTALRADIAVADNPHIHSGYTYLLQLVAHDLVHSSLSLAGSALGAVGIANTRLFPLTLETIYGGGPDVCPHAYEFDDQHRQYIGIIPRTKFRVGLTQQLNGSTQGCPFRDIARAVPAYVRDSGIRPEEQLALDRASAPWRTEALVADARNDDHALISQMTALFHALHNQIIDMIPENGTLAALPASERAYRRFLCARFVVTLIYRNILVKDVLALILHPDVYSLYTGAAPPMLDGQFPGATDAVPVEFTSAAFRFAHSMVRDSYKVNRDEDIPFANALRLSSLRIPGELPVNTNWVVDWSRFFKITDREPNHSHRLGPVYAGPLTESDIFKPLTAMDLDGLPDRDLVTGCYSGLWSVPALCRELRSRGLGTLVPDYNDWKPVVRAWLAEPADGYHPYPLDAADIDALAEDPPLLLFTLLEAGRANAPSTPAINAAAGESLHLGAVGSIIVAETLLGALKRAPIAFETAGTQLKDQVRAASEALLGDATVLGGIPEIATMPELLEFMIAGGAIPVPIPGP